MAKLIQIIDTDTVRGNGTQQNPVRRVRQFWTTDGELLAEIDPVLDPVKATTVAHYLCECGGEHPIPSCPERLRAGRSVQ